VAIRVTSRILLDEMLLMKFSSRDELLPEGSASHGILFSSRGSLSKPVLGQEANQ
jgi:hypothetical protein